MRKKILYLISDRQFGGGSRHLYDLIENLSHAWFEPILISRSSPILEKLKDKIKTYSVEMKNRLDFNSIKEIRKIIIKEKPDLVHLHSTRAGILGALAAKNLKIPIVYTEHLFTHDYIPHNKLIHTYQIITFRYLSKYITKVIVVSQAVKKYLIDKNIFPSERIEVIYHGVGAVQPITNHQSPITKIGSIGALNSLKGYKYLTEAVQNIDGIKLEIVGSGDELAKLQKLDVNKKTKFINYSDNIYKIMSKWDIYVQSSLSESFGLALAEAMAIGLPVIATKVGGMPEIVENGVNGLLVDKKNSQQLSETIKKLINNNELRKKMSENNIKKIKEGFSLDKMVKETERLYDKLITSDK